MSKKTVGMNPYTGEAGPSKKESEMQQRLDELEADARLWDKHSLVEIVEERNDLRVELEKCREDRDLWREEHDLQAEWHSRLQDSLAAAEARKQRLLDDMSDIAQKAYDIEGMVETISVITSVATMTGKGPPSRTALDAALEQARAEGYQRGVEEGVEDALGGKAAKHYQEALQAQARAEERERLTSVLARNFADQPCLLDDMLGAIWEADGD